MRLDFERKGFLRMPEILSPVARKQQRFHVVMLIFASRGGSELSEKDSVCSAQWLGCRTGFGCSSNQSFTLSI